MKEAEAIEAEDLVEELECLRDEADLVVLVDGKERRAWLREAVRRRLLEELAKLDVSVNEEKTRRVDLTQVAATLAFLGFDFRRVLSRRKRWMPLYVPRASAVSRCRATGFRRVRGILARLRELRLELGDAGPELGDDRIQLQLSRGAFSGASMYHISAPRDADLKRFRKP